MKDLQKLKDEEVMDCCYDASFLLTLDFNKGKEFKFFEEIPRESINKIKKYSLENLKVFGNPEIIFRKTSLLFQGKKLAGKRISGSLRLKSLILTQMMGINPQISEESQELFRIFKEIGFD